jgi:ABC-2 type transport system permease protein
MTVLLITLALAFGLGLQLDGVPQAVVVLVFFMPFVWGLGILAAAITLTFRRGSGVVGLAIAGLTLISGLYFPIGLLPDWLSTAAEANPLAIAAEELRHALLGGADWGAVGPDLLILTPLSLLSFLLGTAAFRLALRRERRLGTLGAY